MEPYSSELSLQRDQLVENEEPETLRVAAESHALRKEGYPAVDLGIVGEPVTYPEGQPCYMPTSVIVQV